MTTNPAAVAAIPAPAVAAGPAGAAAIATGNAATTAAAVATLRAGGNAMDAAVAAGFASTVAEPGLTSLAGGGFAAVRTPLGELAFLDFFTTVPGLDRQGPLREATTITVVYPGTQQDFRVGPAAAAVPGVLSGLLALHARYGSLPLATVVAPSVELAAAGVVVDGAQAYVLQLIEAIVRHTPSAAAVYAPGGQLLREGHVLTDTELATFLGHIASGEISGLCSPGIAEPLLSMAADGCMITEADLRAYQPMWREPLRAPLAGSELITNPLPALGGEIVAAAAAGTGEFAHERLVAAMRSATDTLKGQPRVSTGTTQISVVDSAGMVVSMTTTNGAGGGVLVPGTGIHLNNMLGEDDLLPGGLGALVPGERLQSMSAPSLVVDASGTVTALGSGGSARIRTAMATVVSSIVSGAPLAAAIARPRAHLDDDGVVQAEPGVPASAVAALRQGLEVNQWDRSDFYFGGVNAVQRRATGEVVAVADGRRNGSVAVVPPGT